MAARAGRPPQPGDVKTLLVRQLAAASQLLHGKRPITDEVVHDARKMLKRARASLRLLRAIIGDDAYHSENARIRDAAKPLSRMRDAKVILETVNDLDARRPGRRARRELKRIEDPLRVHRKSVRREFLRSRTRAELLRALHAAQRHVERLHLSDSADVSLATGLARVYRLGREAFRRADAVASDDALHEWRKQAKYLAQGLKVFESIEARSIGKLVKRAKSIASDLGTDHDLAVLGDRIVTVSPAPSPEREALFAAIAHRRFELRHKALTKGRKLYRRKTRAFRRRLEKACSGQEGLD